MSQALLRGGTQAFYCSLASPRGSRWRRFQRGAAAVAVMLTAALLPSQKELLSLCCSSVLPSRQEKGEWSKPFSPFNHRHVKVNHLSHCRPRPSLRALSSPPPKKDVHAEDLPKLKEARAGVEIHWLNARRRGGAGSFGTNCSLPLGLSATQLLGKLRILQDALLWMWTHHLYWPQNLFWLFFSSAKQTTDTSRNSCPSMPRTDPINSCLLSNETEPFTLWAWMNKWNTNSEQKYHSLIPLKENTV